jgi:hypothetical protein
MATKMPNGRKIDQTAVKYTNVFHCKILPTNFAQIFGSKIYHLATLAFTVVTKPFHDYYLPQSITSECSDPNFFDKKAFV